MLWLMGRVTAQPAGRSDGIATHPAAETVADAVAEHVARPYPKAEASNDAVPQHVVASPRDGDFGDSSGQFDAGGGHLRNAPRTKAPWRPSDRRIEVTNHFSGPSGHNWGIRRAETTMRIVVMTSAEVIVLPMSIVLRRKSSYSIIDVEHREVAATTACLELLPDRRTHPVNTAGAADPASA